MKQAWWLLAIPAILGFVHLIYWAITRGVIWIASELFNVNWYGKFWVVYIFILIVGSLFGTKTYTRG